LISIAADDHGALARGHCAACGALAEQTGFPLDEVSTIDSYRGSSAAYSYSSVAEVVTALGARFELLQEWRGDYELAGRCPQLLFKKR
jgi:hypothetical protein